VQKIVCAAKFAKITLRKLKAIEPSRRWPTRTHPNVEALAAVVGLSPFHFCRPLSRPPACPPAVCDAVANGPQRLIRETSRNFIEIALEVGYTNPSHFAQVFRPVVGVTPTEFRHAL
jgi:AraC-like DNA-binding protein